MDGLVHALTFLITVYAWYLAITLAACFGIVIVGFIVSILASRAK